MTDHELDGIYEWAMSKECAARTPEDCQRFAELLARRPFIYEHDPQLASEATAFIERVSQGEHLVPVEERNRDRYEQLARFYGPLEGCAT